MERTITFVASLLIVTALVAQDDLGRSRSVPDPQGIGDEQQRQPPMAGSPRAQWDSIGQPHVPDTAFASILLDRSQAERIDEMDRRYSEEFITLGTADRSDPRYQQLWDRRRREVENILTPTQYARWEELNADQLPPPGPGEMPMVSPGEDVTPMPTMHTDSTRSNMPMLKEDAPGPPPHQEPR